MKECWVIPPEHNAEFGGKMEDVLELYKLPYDPDYPVVCFDESCKQLVSETRQPLPLEAGQPERYDHEYERQGVCNLFMFFEPWAGWRHVEVTDHRTQVDYAAQMKYLADVRYASAKKIKLTQDNLNTHVKSSLYKEFPPAEARRILDKFEFHYSKQLASSSPSKSAIKSSTLPLFAVPSLNDFITSSELAKISCRRFSIRRLSIKM